MTTQQHKPTIKKFGIANILLILGLTILLCAEAYCGYQLHTLSSQRNQIKEDYSTINNITFGIFSVDQWRDKIAAIVNGQVQDYSMTPEQKKALQSEVEHALNGLVDKAVASIDKPQKTLGGKLKKFAFHQMVDPKEIHAQVPSFAKTIIDKINSPASQARLKDIATGKLTQLENQTYDNTTEVGDTVTKLLYRRYHVADNDGFNKQVNSRLSDLQAISYNYLFGIMGCILIVFGVWWLIRNQYHLKATMFVMSLPFAFVLIAVGITTSIIEVDARIKTLNFILMGQRVSFDNQVLFFQSKSIVGIVQILLQSPKADAVLVGILMLVFIILFPILRLIFTGVHIMSKKELAENKVVKYFTFESGHWTMADVMIVGILMTYIGLNGILQSQLSNLNMHNGFLNTITENNTSLRPGYYVFVLFVIFSLVLTTIIRRITPYDAT